MRFRFCILLCVCACNLAPRYSRPEVEMGYSYRFEPWDAKEYLNAAWWQQFHDPNLDELIEIALQNNQNLKVASARVLEFYAKYKIVFSQLFPEIGATGNIDRIKLSEDINFQPLIPGVPRTNTLYNFLFNLSYELDFWGKIRNATDAAKAVYLQEVNARRNVVVTLVSSVATTYMTLKQAIDQLKISKLTYQSRLESWKIAQLRFEGGIVSQLDVKQAESEALLAEVRIRNFEILVAKTEDLLSVLLGERPRSFNSGTEIKNLKLPEQIPAGLPADILTNRPDILQAEEAIKAANADVGVARAAFFPTFSLTGIYGQRTTQSDDFFKESATLFDLGLQAFQPLFTGFRLTNQLSESEAILLEALHSYQQTILTALREVSDAFIEHEKAKEKLAIRKNQVAALARYLELAELRYFNGQNDYLTVINAQTSLFDAELLQAETEADVFLSLIALYKSLGQGWTVYEEPQNCACTESPTENLEQSKPIIVGPIDEITK